MEQSLVKLEASRNRAWLVAACLGVIAGLEAASIAVMTPLKEKVPYFVDVDYDTGKVEAFKGLLDKFTPSEINRIYFLKRFVEGLLTMDVTRTSKYLLPEAASYTRATAVNQYKEFLISDNTLTKLVDNPLITRHVENFNFDFVPDSDYVVVRFDLITNDSSGIRRENKRMGIKYSIVAKDMTEKNPIGFFVTDFTIKDEK